MPSTKQQIILQLNEGFQHNDASLFLDSCTEDIRWIMKGDFVKEGKQAIRTFLDGMKGPDQVPPDLKMGLMIEEGDRVASTGTMLMKGKEGEPAEFAFCDIYTFREDRICEMESYVVDLHPRQKEK